MMTNNIAMGVFLLTACLTEFTAPVSATVYACMYQCSQIDHNMDRGSCFRNGCPSPRSRTVMGNICFGGMASPMSHEKIRMPSGSACQSYVSDMKSTGLTSRLHYWGYAFNTMTHRGHRRRLKGAELESRLRRLTTLDTINTTISQELVT